MKEIVAGVVCLLVGFVGVIILSTILNGFVLAQLWAWFIVAPFGLPQISIPVAIGVSMTAKYLTIQQMPKTDENGKTGEAITFAILYPLLTLFIGWIVHFFI